MQANLSPTAPNTCQIQVVGSVTVSTGHNNYHLLSMPQNWHRAMIQMRFVGPCRFISLVHQFPKSNADLFSLAAPLLFQPTNNRTWIHTGIVDTSNMPLNFFQPPSERSHDGNQDKIFQRVPFLYLWPTPFASWWTSGLPLSFWYIGQELDCVKPRGPSPDGTSKALGITTLVKVLLLLLRARRTIQRRYSFMFLSGLQQAALKPRGHRWGLITPSFYSAPPHYSGLPSLYHHVQVA